MATVLSIFIYPTKGEPGQSMHDVELSSEGLDDDRRKGAPVHLVSVSSYVAAHPRANLVLDLDTAELEALVGRRVRIGTTQLEVTGPAKDCPGVYAAVPVPGGITVGDEVEVAVPR